MLARCIPPTQYDSRFCFVLFFYYFFIVILTSLHHTSTDITDYVAYVTLHTLHYITVIDKDKRPIHTKTKKKNNK